MSVQLTSIKSLLREAELSAELISAIIRIVMFVFLVLMIFPAADARSLGTSARIATALYGFGAGLGLVLAWRRIFHPAIPYLFVTFDVVLVVVQVEMLTRLMGMEPVSAFGLPAAALVFVIMIHASMRYRPWLVVYAAALFILSIEVGPFSLAAGQPTGMMMAAMPSMGYGGMAAMMNYQVVPLGLVALAALILFIKGQRTRALLLNSIEQVTRTARLSRYFSPNLAARLAEADDGLALAGRRQMAAVLFVDVRGFTTLGETMTPDELSAFLTEYRNRLTQPVFALGGTVDKLSAMRSWRCSAHRCKGRTMPGARCVVHLISSTKQNGGPWNDNARGYHRSPSASAYTMERSSRVRWAMSSFSNIRSSATP